MHVIKKREKEGEVPFSPCEKPSLLRSFHETTRRIEE
jgi:hypothetical protein